MLRTMFGISTICTMTVWYKEHIEVYQCGSMINEEDLKMDNLFVVFLEIDIFHLYFHYCQRGRLLEDWFDDDMLHS